MDLQSQIEAYLSNSKEEFLKWIISPAEGPAWPGGDKAWVHLDKKPSTLSNAWAALAL